MRLRIGIAITVIGLGVITQVNAQSLDAAIMDQLRRESLTSLAGTISVEVTPNFRGGQLYGCSIGFKALTQDWIYKQGAFIFVSGGFGVWNVQGKLATYLKVTLHDIDPRSGQYIPSLPASAYFVAGNTTTKNAIVQSSPSDLPGTIFVVSHLEPPFSLFVRGLTENKVTIAFARSKGGGDIPLAIDTSVVDTAPNGQRKYSDQIGLNFLNCAKTLVDRL
jgi:hypothetical protein